ncbi:hypothetical protein [Dactylosporangium sp. NPDC005555]|uniref:hypothetical protein n=1 Tax=Dactylosporangium sp. NPDC005555 TaxID=3154889 RepID=UPI0033AA3C53
MATVRAKVIQYLQETRAAEFSVTTLLAANIAGTPEGDYRRRLESQRRRSRERAYRVSDRLGGLGARRSLQYLGVNAALIIGGQAVALSAVPLQLLRGPDGEDRVLKNTRDLCAAAAVLDANYRALEQIAQTCRDEVTAKLAVELRAESEDMLSECFTALDRLAEAVIFGEAEGEPAYQIQSIGAVQMLRLPQLWENMYQLRDAAVDVLRFARGRAMQDGAQLEAGAIIPDYDSLSVEQIRDWLTRLSQTELATVDAHERANRNRTPIVTSIRNLQGKEPWPGYDTMNVPGIRSRLRDADDEKVRTVLEYERSHKDRSSILNASEVQATAT